MPDRPIIFSAPMVRAFLDDRKTQTRRALGTGNTLFNCGPWTKLHRAQEWAWESAWVDPGPSPAGNPGPYLKLQWAAGDALTFEDTVHRVYPIWQPGDRLYVREAWCALADNPASEVCQLATGDGVAYRATDDDEMSIYPRWRPSIHMPRWASRLTLTVTDVRVQRLQDISEADAVAEGVTADAWVQPDGTEKPSCVSAFCDLWNSLHGPRPRRRAGGTLPPRPSPDFTWDANPWVVALTFAVRKGNIDRA